MVFGIGKKKGRGGFISLANANHNMRIERIVYSSSKVTKRLFWVGLVLPDFKISWGILLVYLIVKYPLSLRVRVRCAMRELFIYVRLKRRYMRL